MGYKRNEALSLCTCFLFIYNYVTLFFSLMSFCGYINRAKIAAKEPAKIYFPAFHHSVFLLLKCSIRVSNGKWDTFTKLT